MIEIKYFNEAFIYLDCEYDEFKEIQELFSFYTPNYQWSPRYKSGIWDGKIRLFHDDCLLPYGLLRKFLGYCKLNEWEYKIDDQLICDGDKVSEAEILEFCKELKCELIPRDYQIKAVQYFMYHRKMIGVSATACHAKGDKIIMASGEIKNIEDVKIGDFVIGKDGNPKKVLNIFNGIDDLYEINPKNKRRPIRVTKEHLLHLGFTPRRKFDKRVDTFENISVENYLNKGSTYKHCSKLTYSDSEINFDRKEIDCNLSPYFIGFYLGDGHVDGCAITTCDPEPVKEIYFEANKFNMDVRVDGYTYWIIGRGKKYNDQPGSRNFIFNEFEKIGLLFGFRKDKIVCGKKFIPKIIFNQSIIYRREVLAGLIDSDGHLHGTFFEYSSKSKRLVDDIELLAISLGLVCSKTSKIVEGIIYYRVNIMGNISKIPVKIKRKKNFKKSKTNAYRSGFNIKHIGKDEFYGIQVEDSLYLTDNGMITHNSGKSFIYYILFNLLKYIYPDFKGLLIVPRTSLVEQMAGDFQDYAKNLCDFQKYVHRIYAGREKYTDKPITVSTWQSLKNMPPEYFEPFHAVVVDEVHEATAKELPRITNHCVNAAYRIGMTGHLKDCKIAKIQLTALLGNVKTFSNSAELIKKGILADIEINGIILKYRDHIIKQFAGKNKKEYNKEMDIIRAIPERKRFLCKLAASRKGNTMVLFKIRDYGRDLYRLLKKNFPKKHVYYIDGTVSVKYREQVRKVAEKHEGIIIVASYGTFSTGINIKNLHNLIFAESILSSVKVIQSIGRVLRKLFNKNAKLYDITDDLCWKSKRNYVLKHFLRRIEYYDREQFDYVVTNKGI